MGREADWMKDEEAKAIDAARGFLTPAEVREFEQLGRRPQPPRPVLVRVDPETGRLADEAD